MASLDVAEYAKNFDVTNRDSGVRKSLRALDPTAAAKTKDFTAPTLNRYSNKVDPYAGALEGRQGGYQLRQAEEAAGIERFDPATYRDSLLGGLRANVDQGVRRTVNDTVNAGGSRGLGSSELTMALEQQGRMAGEAEFAKGAAGIDADLMDKVLGENAERRRGALGLTEADLQNKQFGASYGLDSARLREDGRQFDETAAYGGAIDAYVNNVLRPAERKDAMKAGTMQAASGIVAGGLKAAGSIGGAAAPGLIALAAPAAAAACWIAEALYGAADARTHWARYHVNYVWPGTRLGRAARGLYLKHGRRVAAKVERSPALRALMHVPFGLIWRAGRRAQARDLNLVWQGA
jgi:hypothetical protein